jgi:hypothetical protein
MISLDEHTNVHTIWFIGGDTLGFDVLGALYRPKDEAWRIVYRFRYYSGTDDPHDGTDRKTWTQVDDDGRGPDVLAAKFTEILKGMFRLLPKDAYFDTLTVNGNGDDAIRLMATKPWSHMQADGDA